MLSLFLLFLLCYTLVQLPPVQTFLVHKITNSLSKSLGAPVKIESVRLKFFKTATLDGVLIGDQSNDTLFYAKEIDANLSLFSFLDKEIYFDEITLSSGQIHLTRAKDEQDFNYQYIVDYFSSGDSSSASPWNIDLRKIRIYDTHVAITDQHSDQDIHLDIGIFSTYLNKLDLNEKVLDIEQIGLGDSYLVAYTEANQDTSTQSTAISFPNSGWSIRIKQIRLDENDLVYQTRGVTTRPYLNTSDLDVKGLSLFVDDFIWAKDILSAQLTQTSFADHSGFSLDQMTGSLEITPEHIYINDFNLTTPKSHLQNTTDLTFKQFDDLRFFADSVKIKTSFQQSEVDLADLKLLIPDFQETPYLNTG
ncbi:MAG: hypothetical protein KDC53_25785, partial [Saprospiraceae bacterium]|nr:hypothetical protein [Saprospiraceae bacterium]